MELNNKIVVITGGSSGIGHAISAELAKSGAKVYSLSRTIPAAKVEWVIYLQADLTRENDVAAAIAQIPGSIDLLINNAGMMKRANYWELSVEDFDKVWAVDVKGFWLMFKHCRGKLANGAMTLQINSKNSRILKADTFIYTLSKMADLAIDKLVAKDRLDLDMRVAHFGPVDTVLEWTDTDADMKAEKMKVALTVAEAGHWALELINSDKKTLVYDDGAKGYYLE